MITAATAAALTAAAASVLINPVVALTLVRTPSELPHRATPGEAGHVSGCCRPKLRFSSPGLFAGGPGPGGAARSSKMFHAWCSLRVSAWPASPFAASACGVPSVMRSSRINARGSTSVARSDSLSLRAGSVRPASLCARTDRAVRRVVEMRRVYVARGLLSALEIPAEILRELSP